MEAVSNSYLKGDFRLTRASIEELLSLGWCEPSHTKREEMGPARDPDGSPNYYVDWESPIPFARAALLAVETLARVFRIPHPGKLTYSCESFSGQIIRLPSLKLAQVQSKMRNRTDPDTECLVKLGMHRLREVVAQVVAEVTEEEVVEYDDKGNLTIRNGEASVLIHPVNQPRLVQFICPIAAGVQDFADAERSVNRLNAELFVGRVFLIRESGAVLFSTEVLAEPFVRAALKEALNVVGIQANKLLQEWHGCPPR